MNQFKKTNPVEINNRVNNNKKNDEKVDNKVNISFRNENQLSINNKDNRSKLLPIHENTYQPTISTEDQSTKINQNLEGNNNTKDKSISLENPKTDLLEDEKPKTELDDKFLILNPEHPKNSVFKLAKKYEEENLSSDDSSNIDFDDIDDNFNVFDEINNKLNDIYFNKIIQYTKDKNEDLNSSEEILEYIKLINNKNLFKLIQKIRYILNNPITLEHSSLSKLMQDISSFFPKKQELEYIKKLFKIKKLIEKEYSIDQIKKHENKNDDEIYQKIYHLYYVIVKQIIKYKENI